MFPKVLMSTHGDRRERDNYVPRRWSWTTPRRSSEVVSRGTRGTLEYTTRSHRQRRLSERVAASTEEMGMTLGDSSVDCLTTIGGHLFSLSGSWLLVATFLERSR